MPPKRRQVLKQQKKSSPPPPSLQSESSENVNELPKPPSNLFHAFAQNYPLMAGFLILLFIAVTAGLAAYFLIPAAMFGRRSENGLPLPEIKYEGCNPRQIETTGQNLQAAWTAAQLGYPSLFTESKINLLVNCEPFPHPAARASYKNKNIEFLAYNLPDEMFLAALREEYYHSKSLFAGCTFADLQKIYTQDWKALVDIRIPNLMRALNTNLSGAKITPATQDYLNNMLKVISSIDIKIFHELDYDSLQAAPLKQGALKVVEDGRYPANFKMVKKVPFYQDAWAIINVKLSDGSSGEIRLDNGQQIQAAAVQGVNVFALKVGEKISTARPDGQGVALSEVLNVKVKKGQVSNYRVIFELNSDTDPHTKLYWFLKSFQDRVNFTETDHKQRFASVYNINDVEKLRALLDEHVSSVVNQLPSEEAFEVFAPELYSHFTSFAHHQNRP